MARNFDGAGDLISTGASLSNFVTNANATISLWARPTGAAPSTSVAYGGDCLIGQATEALGFWRTNLSGTDRIWAFNWDGNEDRVGITYTVDEWVHLCLIHSGGNLEAFKNGASVGSVASGNTSSLASTVQFGTSNNGSDYAGDLAEAALWNVALTASEILAMARGVSPLSIRNGSALTWYSPFWGLHSPEPDFSPNRRSGTLTNTTRSNHPPVSPFLLPPWVTQTQELAAAVAAARRLTLLGVG